MNNIMPQSQVDFKTWTVSQWINKLGATLPIQDLNRGVTRQCLLGCESSQVGEVQAFKNSNDR